ncbi:MAG: LacI family DNA-binding transcriptional regulator [Lachnospiraceae bacterium]|nr:LacI family DNA-binding transcriptional regulator [Lachnospiraceae bacterium]
MEEKNLTINDIAEELGVSKTTISRAISGKGRIGADTRKKVLEYIEAHNYRLNVIAKGLAQNKTYNIGLVLPGDYNVVELPFFQNCMMGICKLASERDYDVLISMVTGQNIAQLERAVTNHKIDGVILTRTLTKDAPMEYLKESGIPFVAIGSTGDDTVIQIDNDHRRACKELTGNLLRQGIKKIALIGSDESHVVTGNRLRGFEDAFGELDGWQGSREVFLNVDNGRQVEEIVKRLLQERIECIVTMDDFLCGCVLDALQRSGAQVPDEVQVGSFYDSTFLANHMPSVTSIRFNVEELGTKACELLLDLLEEKDVERRTLLGYEVRMRRSTRSFRTGS